ncbi:MAG: YdiY family protein [Phycisphaerales bacterium JB063]
MARTTYNMAALATTLGVAVWAGPGLADTVELTNGDTLTGRVVSQDESRVVLEHDVLGRVELEAARVQAVTRDVTEAAEAALAAQEPEPEPEEQQAQPEPPAAPAQPAADPAQVQQDADAAAEQQAIDDRSLMQIFIDDWGGKLTLGFNGAAGNTDNLNFYASINGKRQVEDNRWTFNAQWFYGTNRGNTNRSQFNSTFTRDWLKSDDGRLFYFIRGEYQYDRFRAYESRASGYGGAGYTLYKSDDIEVNTRLGFGGTYEFGDVNEFTPEALFGGSVLNWKITDRATISGEAIWYPSLEDSSQYRITSKLEWVYKLDVVSGLSLKFGVQSEYLSQTPGDRDHNDLRYYGALEIKF